MVPSTGESAQPNSNPQDDALPHAQVSCPAYHLPRRVAADLIWAAGWGHRRSFAYDSRRALQGLDPPLEVLGAAHIPPEGPCLIVCNHYSRPGFGAWWIALGISAAVAAQRRPGAPTDVHWVMTAAWRYPEGDWRRWVITPVTAWAFARAARVYGHVTMPPMPPHPQEMEARAAAVLRTVLLAQELTESGGLLGLAPQGYDTADPLGCPPKGAGAFIALLANGAMPILPVGVTEQDGRLRLSFGQPFAPRIPPRRADRDSAVIEQVMAALAHQLGWTKSTTDCITGNQEAP